MSNWSFITHISEHLTRPKLGEQKAPTLWPSSATAIKNDEVIGKCRRQAFFRYASDKYLFSEEYDKFKKLYKHLKDKKLPRSKYSEWIFRQGDLYEDYCINMAKESGVFIATQVQIYIPEFNISGKLDLVTMNPETGQYHIVEVKSVYGFNSNSVLGTEAQQKKGFMGEPRDSNLMQIGIYQWWYGNTTDNFGPALLVYGSRDTGRYGEYKITVETSEEDGLDYIWHEGCAPIRTQKTNSGICIQSILSNYKLLQDSVENFSIPEADYTLVYSQDKIEKMYQLGLLGKVDTAQHEKRKKQIEEGKKRLVKPVEKGDWQCRFCEYKEVCYTKEAELINLDSLLEV